MDKVEVDDLIEELCNVNVRTWAYADDIAFGFEDCVEFNRKMAICDNWAAKTE